MTSFQATLVNAGFGQLLLRDSLGKVAQKWTLSNPKCVIGTGTNCNVSCQLPGIVDHHVLMVIGAKQVFIRALAGGLTRNGQNITELVIPGNETEFNFEIAGHHFQFARDGVSTPVTKEFVQETASARPLFASAYNDAPGATLTPDAPPADSVTVPVKAIDSSAAPAPTTLALAPSRLKFTVVRALEKNRQTNPGNPSMMESDLSSGRPAWVEAIVRDALRPVEERLDDLNGPLQTIERRLRRQRAQLRKAHKQSLAAAENLPAQSQIVPVLAPELIQSQAVIEQYVQKHSSQLEKVTQSVGQIVARLSDVDRQLSTTQAERQELSQQFQQSNGQILAMQQDMLALVNGLQSQLKNPIATETNSEARLWQSNIEAQLAKLQATLLALDDIKTTLQAAVEQNRMLKSDLEIQQNKLGKLITESTQKAIAEAMALANNDSETLSQVVGDKVCDSLREQLGTRFTSEIAEQLSDSLNNEFALPLTSQLSSQISNQFSQELTQHLSQIAPAAAPAANSEIIVQALRDALAEMLAPLAGTLQSSLQQSVQQAVDQSLQQSVQQAVDQSLQQSVQQAVAQSLQQSVQQTIVPMIEAANSAQMRAVAALPQLQLQLPIVESNAAVIHSPRNQIEAEPVAFAQPQVQPPVTAWPEAVYLPAEPTLEDEQVRQAYEEAANSVSDSQAYDPSADPSQGFDSQPYRPPGYDSRAQAPLAFDSQPQDSQAYVPQPEPQAYEPHEHDSQAYDPQEHDSQAYVSQKHDSQAWVPDSELQAYDSQSYSPQPGFDSELPPAAPASVESVDSHAQELPSWWSDDPVANQPASGAYPVSADNDAIYGQTGNFPANNNISADAAWPPADAHDYTAPGGQEVDVANQYAQSAFSAEQLDLRPNENSLPDPYQADVLAGSLPMPSVEGMPNAYSAETYAGEADVEEAYDSVPYSELVNRRPASEDAGAADEYASADYQEYLSEAYDNVPESEHRTQAAPVAENPTVPASQAKSGEETDESVEDYMRRLLARMRGVSESEVTIPGAQAEKPASAVVSKDPSVAQPAPVVEAESGEQMSEAWTEPFDPDKYVPRGSAPEKNRDLNALRELANTSARSAIQVSARRRQGSAILIKSTIALVGLIAGIALVSINGARINIAFIATVASFLVAVIWGYDAATSIRPLVLANRNHSQQKRESDNAHKAAKAEEADA